MSLSKTTKNELINALKKLKFLDTMTELKEAIGQLQLETTIIQPDDHREIISFIVEAANKYPRIKTDPNNDDLINLCTQIINDAQKKQPSPHPRTRK